MKNKKIFFGVLECGELEFLGSDIHKAPIDAPFKFIVEASILKTWLQTLVAFSYISESPRAFGTSICKKSKKIWISRSPVEGEEDFSFSVSQSMTLLSSLLSFSNPLIWEKLLEMDT